MMIRRLPFTIRTSNIKMVEKITGKKLKRMDFPTFINHEQVTIEPMKTPEGLIHALDIMYGKIPRKDGTNA